MVRNEPLHTCPVGLFARRRDESPVAGKKAYAERTITHNPLCPTNPIGAFALSEKTRLTNQSLPGGAFILSHGR